MKALRTLAYLFIFGVTLTLGLHAGRTTAATLIQDHPNPTSQYTPLPPTPEAARLPGNGQQNLLVIAVDSLTVPQPQLEGIWLVLYIRGYPQITLLPIFPQATGEASSGELPSLEENFHLSPDGSIESTFIDALEARQLWWNAFVIIDKAALDELIQWTNQDPVETSGTFSVEHLANPSKDRYSTLASQYELAQSLCVAANQFSSENDKFLTTLASRHHVTDLDLQEATNELQEILSYHQKLVCEFPTFSGLQNK